jgi:hypothetical protein
LLEKLLALHPVLGIQCPWILQNLSGDLHSNPEIALM